MKILLTNDDGYQASGLAAIRAALIGVGAQVVTVAPAENCSGFARACTFSRPVKVKLIVAGENPVYSCDGTPTDCVRVGLLGQLAEGISLVVSGINHGANLADDITYSGTVGAALEAAILGIPSLALSQQTPTGSFAVNYTENLEELGLAYDFTQAADHAALLAVEMVRVGASEPVVLSVNYPSRFAEPIAVLTRPGKREYPVAAATPWADGEESREIYLFGEPDQGIPEPESIELTDIAALRSGRISISPLSYAFALGDLPHVVAQFLETVSAGLRDSHGYEGFSRGGPTAVA